MTTDWIVIRDRGLWLLGLPSVSNPKHLTKVFELTCQVQQSVNPATRAVNVDIRYGAQPPMLLPSMAAAWTLTDDAATWPVKGLSSERSIRDAIANCEKMIVEMRAAASGIVVPKVGLS